MREMVYRLDKKRALKLDMVTVSGKTSCRRAVLLSIMLLYSFQSVANACMPALQHGGGTDADGPVNWPTTLNAGSILQRAILNVKFISV